MSNNKDMHETKTNNADEEDVYSTIDLTRDLNESALFIANEKQQIIGQMMLLRNSIAELTVKTAKEASAIKEKLEPILSILFNESEKIKQPSLLRLFDAIDFTEEHLNPQSRTLWQSFIAEFDRLLRLLDKLFAMNKDSHLSHTLETKIFKLRDETDVQSFISKAKNCIELFQHTFNKAHEYVIDEKHKTCKSDFNDLISHFDNLSELVSQHKMATSRLNVHNAESHCQSLRSRG